METASQSPCLGLDIGGTSVRAAAVDRTGSILCKARWATDRSADRSGFLDALVAGALRVAAPWGTDAPFGGSVGVAVPGTLDRRRRRVVRSVNLPLLEGNEFAEALAFRLATPVRLCTDAEAATWGEYLALPTPPDRFVHLRLGTGVGCGVVLGGALRRTDFGRTDHLEELVVESKPDMPRCPCGRKGCLETIASGVALNDRAETCGISGGLTGLQDAVATGDDAAMALLDDVAGAVSTVVDRLADRYAPAVLVLGGGVIDHLPPLFERIEQVRRARGGPSGSRGPRIEHARRGDDAGVIGAAWLGAMPSESRPCETHGTATDVRHEIDETFGL